jgi:hypothetical protein
MMSHSHTARSEWRQRLLPGGRFGRLLRWTIAIPALAGAIVALPLLLVDARSGTWQGLGICVLVLVGIVLTAALRPPSIVIAACYVAIWSLASVATMAILLNALRL